MNSTKAEAKPRFPLRLARMVANHLYDMLLPACERLTIAGSIRRGRPDVGDIELLAIPRIATNPQALLPALINIELLQVVVNDLLQIGSLGLRGPQGKRIGYGPLNKFLVHIKSGIPVDLFTTSPEFWGMALFVRTGPAEYNVRAFTRLRSLGLRGHAYGGVTTPDGVEHDCPDESTVFDFLGWGYTDPEERK